MTQRPARPIGPLTEEQAKRAAWDAEVKAMELVAEQELRGERIGVPDVIYSGLQEAGLFSADPEIDADPRVAERAGSLLGLVKEHSVSPSGNWEMALTDRELEAVHRGEWCTNCYSPQRFTPEEWEQRMLRLEQFVGPRPSDSSPETRCPVCGAQLGIHGMIKAEVIEGPGSFTPEQQALVEEFFGGDYRPNMHLVEDEENEDADGSEPDQSGGGRDGAGRDE